MDTRNNLPTINEIVALCLQDIAGGGDYSHWLTVFPDLVNAKTTAQSPVYHAEGDVWTHTCMVIDSLTGLEFFKAASQDDQVILFLAALLHDVSKAYTTKIDPKTNQIGHPGHSPKGAVLARRLLWEYGVPFEIREQVCQLIAHHQVPFYALEGTKEGHDAIFVARRLSQRIRLDLLCTLARADMLGRICNDQAKVLQDIEIFELIAQEEQCWNTPRAFASDYTRLKYCAEGNSHPDFELHMEQGSEVIVMCGPPASGKDTWVAKFNQAIGDWPVLSFDDAKAELGLRHGQNDGQAAHLVTDKAKALLREKAPFVWNATHLSKQMRSKTLDLLHSYKAKTTVVYLEADKATLLSRNSKRDSTLNNKSLLGMLEKWEVPTREEAHAVLYMPGVKEVIEHVDSSVLKA